MLLSKKIKLEVSQQDAVTLEFMQGKCRGLYNWWIGRLRDGEEWPGWKNAKATLQESKGHDPELCHARLGPCTGDPVRCAEYSQQPRMFQHI